MESQSTGCAGPINIIPANALDLAFCLRHITGVRRSPGGTNGTGEFSNRKLRPVRGKLFAFWKGTRLFIPARHCAGTIFAGIAKLTPNTEKTSEHVKAVRRLKAEIDRLTKKQADVLRVATRIGMTPDEAKQYDSWQTELVKLVDELRTLGEL
jgi:hypothetical protein